MLLNELLLSENYDLSISEETLKLKSDTELAEIRRKFENIIVDIDKELSTRKTLFSNLFGLKLTDNHPYLNSLISNIQSCKYIEDEVETRRISIPFYGLALNIDNESYTIMVQTDSDYGYRFTSFCKGDPFITRTDSNIYDVDYDEIHSMSEDELEKYFTNTELSELSNIEVLTMIYCRYL